MPAAMFFCTTATKITRIAAAKAARLSEPRQVGGLSKRAWRRSAAVWRAADFDDDDDAARFEPPLDELPAGLLVRPGRSIVPAWVPRCLRLRLRLVWAMPC